MPFFIFGSGCVDARRDDLNGTAVYRDARTNLDGTPHLAAAPDEQHAPIVVVMTGTGTLVDVAPPCVPDRRFVVRYDATIEIDDKDVFTSDVDKTGAELTTPTGCAIGHITRGTILSIVVHAALATDEVNCGAFCAAQARADAEAQCGSADDDATCRTQSAADANVTCLTTCTTQAVAIVGDGTVSQSDLDELGSIDSAVLRTGTIARLQANLRFERLELASGTTLARSIDRREARL